MSVTVEPRLITEATFVKVIRCGDCRAELNRTVEMKGLLIWERWTQLAFGSALASGRCPNGCRSTFSDLNLNVSSQVIDVATGHAIDVNTFKLLTGRFYSDDEDKVCTCHVRLEEDWYRSDHYPAVHGPCGLWQLPFRRP